ncbi:MAG: spore germination protein GerW family protein [Clostridia bacterium]
MQNDQIQQIVDTAVTNIKHLAEVNTIVGQPIVTSDGSVILPVSELTFAFVAGGGEYGKKGFKQLNDNQFAGGSGGGASVTPVGFLVVNKDGVKIIKAQEESAFTKIIDTAKTIYDDFKKS